MTNPAPQRTEYLLSDAFFRQSKRVLLTRSLPLVVLAAGVGLFLGHGTLDGASIASGVLISVVLATSFAFNVRRHHRSFRTYRLILDANSVTRTQDDYATLRFEPHSIAEIVEDQNGITVIGTDGRARLGIPRTLDRFDDCKDQLTSLHPISVRERKPTAGLITPLACIGVLGGMFVVYRSHNPALVLAASAGLIAALVWSFIAIQRSPLLERRVKRWAWMMILVLFSLGAAAYTAAERLLNR